MNARWRRWFGWSKSRASLFRECRKRYSFQYLYKYEDQVSAQLAKVLGKLADLPIQKGLLLHQEIETCLQVWQKTGEMDLATSQDRLTRRFQAVDPMSLRELRFQEVTRKEIEERLRLDLEDAQRQLLEFHQVHWPRLSGHPVVSLEKLEKFLLDGDPVWVSADLVLEDPETGGLLLVDWKTGLKEHDADDSEQLGGYILWAHERFRVPLEKIEAELVWLSSGRVDRTRRQASELQSLRDQIHADCQEMLAISDYSQISAAPAEGRCRRCPFLPLCREGAAWIDPAVKQSLLADLRREVGGSGRGARV